MATTITANGINFPDGSASAPSIGGTDTNTGLFTGSDIVGFATGGNERLRITSDGELLVGTTVDNGFKFKVSDGGGYEFAFAPNDSSINSLVNYNRSGGAYVDCKIVQKELQLWTGTSPSERLRITSAGSVGIGTASPAAMLQVGGATIIGSANTTKTQDGVIIERNSGDGMAHITAGRAGGNYSGLNFYVAGASGVTLRQQIDYQSNFKFFGADGTSERLRITSAGNVGIGTASPGHKLSILGGSSSQLEIKGTEADLWLNSTGPSGGGIWRILGSTGSSTHRFRIYDNTNSREPFYIDGGTGHSTFTRASTGTVAHFITNARECNILLQNDARTWKIVNYDYTNAGADNLGFHDGTADRFIIKNNGNVQIPDGDLEVASGHGIDFSATSHASGMSSELLDSYEEGTWTPSCRIETRAASDSPTDAVDGCYTKVGRVVTCHGRFTLNGTPTERSTGRAIEVHGFPFDHNHDWDKISGDIRVTGHDIGSTYGQDIYFLMKMMPAQQYCRIEIVEQSYNGTRNASPVMQDNMIVIFSFTYVTT